MKHQTGGALAVRAIALIAASISFGCQVLTYPLITDNDGTGSFVVNTNGKAHVESSSQAGAAVGGRFYTTVDFLDQTSDGRHKVTNYQIEMATTEDFITETYCNPNWTGCAYFTNDYTPPGASCTFAGSGGHWNYNCLQFPVFGICFSSRPGECGRGSLRLPQGLQASDIVSLLSMGIGGGNELVFNLNAANTRIELINPQGSAGSLRIVGNQEVRVNLRDGRAIFDLSSPNATATIRKAASLSDSGFRSGVVQVTYGNVTRRFNYAALRGDTYRDLLLRHGM